MKSNNNVHFNDMDNNTDNEEENINNEDDTLEPWEEWCPICGCNKGITDDTCPTCGC